VIRSKVDSSGSRTGLWLTSLIAIQLVLYAFLTTLSWQFEFHSHGPDRPLIAVLIVFAALFIAYLASIPAALRVSGNRRWMICLFAVAIAMRAIVLFSEPIQEVDLYRYIWDGTVADQGISPYRYRPIDIRTAIESDEESSGGQDPEVGQLAVLAASSEGLQQILNRVHFAQLPTVYPPVSQFVFRAVQRITPVDAGVKTRVRLMKFVIVLFDVGVIGLLWLLLRLLGQNPGWIVAYGWSPLVIKEFANSGHLDSIAVFLTMASIVCVARACHLSRAAGEVGRGSGREGVFPDSLLPTERGDVGHWAIVSASAIFAGLAVGAKLYPIILFPLMAIYLWRQLGRNLATLWALTACLMATGSLAPMIFSDRSTDPLEGLTTFINRWEMNDLLFMVIEENIRPEGSVPGQPPLWFTIVPDSWRVMLINATSPVFGGDIERTPFLLARLLTTTIFIAIVFWFCRRIWKNPDLFAESAFLTIAWFWFLSPTQNPWYWTWALPLVPFARSRIWLSVSGLALVYYSRFWFEYHGDVVANWGTAYQGVQFYDFMVVWLVFGPFLLTLCGRHAIQQRSQDAPESAIP
jgi:hypothetical protein